MSSPLLLVRSSGVLIPVPDYKAVEEYQRAGRLSGLAVQHGDFTAEIDLETGELRLGDECVSRTHPGAPLRPIYYIRRSCETGGDIVDEFTAIGWQSTVGGRNVRFGARLYPSASKWIVTEDI